jgi:hypothetical protein
MAATLAILKAMLWPGRRVGCLSASFRQAKQIFEEISHIWQRSPILQQCTERQPILSNDACRLNFKTIAGHNPSVIMALPLADGAKIRGARFHTIIVDECVHVPPDVFNMVIRPMAATHQDPTKAVRIEQEKDKILASSLSDELKAEMIAELDGKVGANQIIQLTSGYYTFNYVYDLYCKYSDRMHGIVDISENEEFIYNPDDYATFQIPWWSLPKGFLSEASLRDARRDMSPLQFRMEYEAAWISDSGGFFKASDVEGCRSENQGIHCEIELKGEPNKTYLMSIDPARTSDAFAIIISEFDVSGQGYMKIRYAEQHFNESVAKMVRRIFELTKVFNVIQIGIDKGGGGHQIADFLAEGSVEDPPIYDMNDERYRGLRGRHILRIVDFTSNWIEEAHHKAYNLLQRRQIVFPKVPLEGGRSVDSRHRIYKTIEEMIIQILSVEPSETRTGKLHFGLPRTGGGFVQHKDLYSAFIIGCDMVYDMVQQHMIPTRKIPLIGVIRSRGEDKFLF